MILVAIAWLYVVLMMAVAEAVSAQGSVLGAVATFVLYGLLPLAVVLYIMGTPGRRRARLRVEQAQLAQLAQQTAQGSPNNGSGVLAVPETREAPSASAREAQP